MTTLVDASLSEPDADYYAGGTIWFLSGTHAGKTARIISLTGGNTFTFASLGVVVAAGVNYAVCPADFPRDALVQAVGSALLTIGEVPARNTSLVTNADQEAYSLPAGVMGLRRVEVAEETTAPLDYWISFYWREIGGQLVFDTTHAPEDPGRSIRLTYVAPAQIVTEDNDTISDYIHPDLLTWLAAEHAWRWKCGRLEGDKPSAINSLNESINKSLLMRALHPIPSFDRDPRLAGW